MQASEIVSGIYVLELQGQVRLATRPEVPAPIYGERIIEGYRLWDPRRSKLAALVLKSYLGGGHQVLFGWPDSKVLYLGAATGTTVSHVSDVAREGVVYAVEFSPRSMRDLLNLCESRKNIIPLLEDAAQPEMYGPFLEPVDVIYQDVAQRNQADIASRNAVQYLKPGGSLVLMIKARSVDVTLPPKEVCRSELGKLEGVEPLQVMDLRPYHQDHFAVVCKKPHDLCPAL